MRQVVENVLPHYAVSSSFKFMRQKFNQFYRCPQIYVKKSLNANKVDGLLHSFNALSMKFGSGRPNEDVFELFGEFEKGQRDVLFDVSSL